METVERTFREYSRLLEVAARSADPDVVLEAAHWPVTVMALAVDREDDEAFERAAQCLVHLYYLSQLDIPHRSRDFLRDRSRTYLKEFGQFHIGTRLQDATSAHQVDVLTTTARSLLDAFTELLKGAIDSGDAEFFTEAAGDYWQALPLRLFGNDRVDTSLDSEDTAGAALPRAMGTFRAEVESRRSALWTALGAWCVEWISSETTASVTNRRIFATIADRLPDFRTLWQAFLRSLDEESRGRFPLTWWERGKSRAEGMITWQKPGRLQARFFALLALARVPPDVDESITGLAVPEQASWVRGLVNGALDDLGPAARSGASCWARPTGKQRTTRYVV
jgi:hypothetical protein